MADEEVTTEVTAEGTPAQESVAEPARKLPEQAMLAGIVEPYATATWIVADDEWVLTVDAADYSGLVAAAKAAGFETFIDLCGVDYFRRDPRFEVVLTLLNYTEPMRLRVRVGAEAAAPQVASVTDLFPGANFFEREAYDLLGIDFVGHPDLTRILMPDDWEGHPLRKDTPVGSVPIQFRGTHKVQ